MKHFYSVNLDHRTTLFFNMLFDRHWGGQYVWTNKPGGDFAVVDLDLFKGRDAFKQFRQQHPDTSLLWFDRVLTGSHTRRFRDHDPTLRARTQAVSGLRP